MDLQHSGIILFLLLGAGNALGPRCSSTESDCRGTCYDPNFSECVRGQTGDWGHDFLYADRVVCPIGDQACGWRYPTCFSPITEHCVRGCMEYFNLDGVFLGDREFWTVCSVDPTQSSYQNCPPSPKPAVGQGQHRTKMENKM